MILLRRLFDDHRSTIGSVRAFRDGLSEPLGPWRWTIERPWQGNRPFVSRVPSGEYALLPHDGSRWRGTYALVGGTVSHAPDPRRARSAIVIHPANRASELAGCIAAGEQVEIDGAGEFSIGRSRAATLALVAEINALPPEERRIWIAPPSEL